MKARNSKAPFRLVLLATTFAFCVPSQAQMIVGTNLDGVSPWAANHFVDVFKNQSAWVTRNADNSGDWDSGFRELIPVNDLGWPTELPFDPGNGSPLQMIHTQMPIRGAGVYQLLVEGAGRLEFLASDGLLDPTSPWQRSVTFTPSGGTQIFELEIFDSEYGDGTGRLFLNVHESDSGDPLRNMKLIAPGHESTYETDPFAPTYVEDLAYFSNIRFMDWGQTNASPLVSWSERTTTDFYTQTDAGGTALEYQILMANQQSQSTWFCVPAQADDEFVRNMARMIRDELNPELKVFIEYSNETWNFIFSQTTYVQDQGELLSLDADRWVAGQKYVSLRSAQIWQIFEEEFGDESANRLVKVMSGFAANAYLTRQRMEYLDDPTLNPSGQRADAVAIAPYFGGGVPEQIIEDDIIESVTVDEILDMATEEIRGFATNSVVAHQQIASDFDAWLLTYEGGQHLVAPFSHWNDETMTEKLIEANRHPRMYDLYVEYMDMMRDNGVALHSNFSYVAVPSQYGSWGLHEYQGQPFSEAHKARATRDWIGLNPPGNIRPIAKAGRDVQVIDLDGTLSEHVVLDGSASRDFDGQIVSYEWSSTNEVLGTSPVVELELPVGRHLVSLVVTDNGGEQQSSEIVVTIAPESAQYIAVESDFDGNAPSENRPWTQTSQIDANINFGGWTFDAPVHSSAYDDVFAFFGIFGADPQTYAEAIANDAYISFTVQPNEGFELDLRGANLTFTIERIFGLAPTQYYLHSSVDGFAVGDAIADGTNTSENTAKQFIATLPFDSYQTTDPIEFRIYLVGGQYGGHHLSLNQFQLHGAAVSTILLGDINRDGAVDRSDIKPFLNLLENRGYQLEADMNQDGEVNGRDVRLFVRKVRGG